MEQNGQAGDLPVKMVVPWTTISCSLTATMWALSALAGLDALAWRIPDTVVSMLANLACAMTAVSIACAYRQLDRRTREKTRQQLSTEILELSIHLGDLKLHVEDLGRKVDAQIANAPDYFEGFSDGMRLSANDDDGDDDPRPPMRSKTKSPHVIPIQRKHADVLWPTE